MFETFLLAIYNEEILAGGPGSPVMNKKSEEIRIPSVGYPSIYHDPSKIQPYPEVTQLKYGGSPSVQVIDKCRKFEQNSFFRKPFELDLIHLWIGLLRKIGLYY